MSFDQDTDSLRVLHGAYWFATATINLANEQAKRHRVMYITTQKAVHYAGDTEWKDLFDSRISIRLEALPTRKNPIYHINRAVGLMQGLISFRADVLHFQEANDPTLYLLLPRLKRIPLVITVHDPLPHLGDVAGTHRYYERRKDSIHALRRRADHIITLGHEVKEQLLSAQSGLDPDRISVVLHFPMNHLLHWRRPEHIEKPGTVLFFGRMLKYKGLGLLLDAWQLVRKACPNANLIVAGRGDELDSHRDRLIRESQCTLMEQYFSTADVARLFAESSIVVLPYLEATQSGPLSIAVAFGKPVVVTKVGGLPEMVDHNRSGLVVPANDPRSLADALISLLSDEGLHAQMVDGTRKLAETRLSVEVLAKQTEDVYRQAIRHRQQCLCESRR